MIMKKTFITAAIILIAHGLFAADKPKIRVAVMDLKPNGVSPAMATTVSNMLRTELINLDSLEVIERSQMDAILKEQGLQNSGLTDQSVAVRIGQLMAAKKIVVGEVSRMGSAIMITIRIVDVETALSEYSSSEKAETEAVLDNAVKVLAKNLSVKIENKSPEIYTASGYYLRGIVPGWAQLYANHPIHGGTFVALFTGSVAWTTVAFLNYRDSKDKYDSLPLGTPVGVYDKAYDQKKKDWNIFLASAITLSCVYVANWVDVIFFTKPKFGEQMGMIRIGSFYAGITLGPDTTYNRNSPSGGGAMRTGVTLTRRF